MKKIIVVCDSNITTSQQISTRLEFLLQENGLGKVTKVFPVPFANLKKEVPSSDVLVTIGKNINCKKINIPTFNGGAFLNPYTQIQELNKMVEVL